MSRSQETDTETLEIVSARPRMAEQQRISFHSSARLCRRAREEARRRGFSSLAMWLRTMMWQMVSEVDEE